MSYTNYPGGESVTICPNCGAQNSSASSVCRSCGNQLTPAQQPAQQGYNQQPSYQQPSYQQPAYQQPSYQPQPSYQQPAYQQPSYQPQPSYQQPQPGVGVPAGLTQQQFYEKHLDAATAKNLKTWCIVGYVLTGINVLVGFLNPVAFVDVVIQLALLLGVHMKKIKGCAIGVLVYAIISMIIGLASTGSLTGWGWLVVGIGLMSTFGKMEKQYKDYQASGAPQFPQY